MKFSDIDQAQWNELKPYLDTVLLPVSGLQGNEEPWKAKETLLKVGEVLEWIEIPFKGRCITYPALHYEYSAEQYQEMLSRIGKGLKECGFRFVIIVSYEALPFNCPDGVDLVINHEDGQIVNNKTMAAVKIQQLWEANSEEGQA